MRFLTEGISRGSHGLRGPYRRHPRNPWFCRDLRMLMTQFVSKFGDYRVHLILQLELFLLQLNFLKVIMLRHVVTLQLLEASFVLFMFLDQTAKLWARGNQVLLDLLLLHHHRAPPNWMDNFDLTATVTYASASVQSETSSSMTYASSTGFE